MKITQKKGSFEITYFYSTLYILDIELAEKNTTIDALEQDEGYAVIAIYSKGYAEKIVFEGTGFGNTYLSSLIMNNI